jgi:hypothetical protein
MMRPTADRQIRTTRVKPALASGVLAAACVVCAGCSSSGSTTSTGPSPSTPAPVTETFSGTLPVGGTTFYSFGVASSGTVNVTLVSVTINGDASDVSLTVGLGSPSGTLCSATSPTAVQAGAAPVTGSEVPGVYCVNVQDAGPNLPAPANFTITIAHP